MILDALLAFGIVMSFATQIPALGLPITFGELALSLWIIPSVGRVLAGGEVAVTPALKRLGTFWLALALFLYVGVVVGYFTSMIDPPAVLHDTIAYLLLALVTCLIAAAPHAPQRLRRCAWYVVAIANVVFAFQIGLAWGVFHQSNIEPWFWDRFRGWSQNPNQLALYCAAVGPIALHLATTTKSPLAKIVGFAGLIIPFYLGRMTKSDTYLFTTILVFGIFVMLRLRTWLSVNGSNAMLGRRVVVLLLLVSIPLALALTPYGTSEFGNVESFAKSQMKDKGGAGSEETAALRLSLWNQALEIGLQSASLGLGPGPHLDHFTFNRLGFMPIPFEAHDTILDIFTQGGLAAILRLFWIVGSAALFAWRAKLDALLALVASLTIFSIPHLIVRHPIVWFAITLCLVTGSDRLPYAVQFSEA